MVLPAFTGTLKENLMPNPQQWTPRMVASAIDHTNLRPGATEADITKLCDEADQHGFAAVCVNPTWVKLAKELLSDSPVRVCTVIGFPLGATTSRTKLAETKDALENGADEIDVVINMGWAITQVWDAVCNELASIAVLVHEHGKIMKVIIETSVIGNDRIQIACIAAMDAGADFVKTSTGFNGGGATVAHIEMMRRAIELHQADAPTCQIKASGGVSTWDDAIAMLEAGAKRIGTSNGIAIITGAPSSSSY